MCRIIFQFFRFYYAEMKRKWNYFYSWKNEIFFSKKEITEIIFSTSCKKLKIFLSYFLKKKKNDWPKAYAGPRLPTLPYFFFRRSCFILFFFELFEFFWIKIFFIIKATPVHGPTFGCSPNKETTRGCTRCLCSEDGLISTCVLNVKCKKPTTGKHLFFW